VAVKREELTMEGDIACHDVQLDGDLVALAGSDESGIAKDAGDKRLSPSIRGIVVLADTVRFNNEMRKYGKPGYILGELMHPVENLLETWKNKKGSLKNTRISIRMTIEPRVDE
jgi:hypothetical protein